MKTRRRIKEGRAGRRQGSAKTPRCGAVGVGWSLAATFWWAAAAPLAGQDPEPERLPSIPGGVPAVVFPVQATTVTPGGAWVGGMPNDRATIDLLNAELEFAFGEEEGARDWALGPQVEDRLARNPMIRVDPRRLAYHGLLREPERHSQIYEPLHTQLRQVAALFGARIVVLPLNVWYRGPSEAELAAAQTAGTTALGRAVLLAAVIDVRRSAVLWHGIIEGDAAEATSRASLTTLALRVAHQLAPS